MTICPPRSTSKRLGKPLGVAKAFGGTVVEGEGATSFSFVSVGGAVDVDGSELASAVAVAVEIAVGDEMATGGSYEPGHRHHTANPTIMTPATTTRHGRRMYRGTESPPH